MIERVKICTWWLRSREIGAVVGGGQSGGGSSGGRHGASSDSIHWLTCDSGNVEN